MTSTLVKAEVIHQERSLYRNILVEDNNDLRCLKFNTRSTQTQQSCFLKSQPDHLVFNYTKLLMASLLFNTQPKRILIVGLGGGTMSNTLAQLYPQSEINNIEIDPAVIKVARDYFGFLESNKIKTYAQDGRIFIKRALLKKESYDWIILDAFNGDYIPEHLMTKEFLQEAKALLSDNGILSANTFSLSKLYAHESATYKAVFGDFYQVTNNANSNRIIVVSKNGFSNNRINNSLNKQNIDKLDKTLSYYGVDIPLLYRKMINTKNNQDWPNDTRVLTDQFSPANLLNVK
ncbi:fused MFS/spermidine synthase [Colwellia sp. 1_MG-2023]|uniref:spermidine synthase n=1 Tax=unclassified Colwellia TaxID=196834 RepID=UPI002091AC3A|nr:MULTISPECIES: fused MFS/spermidine synthase [unclassified Colwellia]MDO6652412.1 fused MFS/spermidine synthase [Colwellia sp. 3_MG-2023]MDO6665713.1 fused MFS/spermidine synthase [Colwellia sp. 2_MG-2023]MDO6690086.1 fused MFS/spermidine synthase [Colwellia sp. 1_MG-2023]